METPACHNHDPEIFFPEDEMVGEGANKRPSDLAKNAIRICEDECKVKDWCLGKALTNGEETGIWGGMTTDQRRALLRRMARRRRH